MSSSSRLSSALPDAGEAGDLTTLLRRRLSHADSSVIGFYDQSARDHRIESQSTFLGRAAGVGAELLAAGTCVGDRIVVSSTSPESALLGFCGSVLIGAVPTLVSGRVAFEDAEVVARKVTDALALVGDNSRLILQARDEGPSLDIELDPSRVTLLDPSRIGRPASLEALGVTPHISGSSESHIQLTSGSTGEGKGIVVTHASLLANCAALRSRLELAPNDVFASWLPLNHDMGLVGQALLALVNSIDLYLLSPFDFMADPLSWLRTISDHGANVATSPNFGYQHVLRRVGDADLAELDLSSWRSACCGAEPVSARLADAFLARFSSAGFSPTTFTPCYGLAEATLAVTMPELGDRCRSIRVTRPSLAKLGAVVVSISSGEPRHDEIDVVALGKAMDGLSIRLVDEAGATIDQPLVCGEVIVSGSSVAGGTIDSDGNVEPFPADGVHTGDVGFMEHGDLFVVERMKNVVIRNGQNYSGLVIEQTLARLAGVNVHHALVVDTDLADGTGLTGVVALIPGADVGTALDGVEEGLAEFELSPEVVVAVPRGSLPVTTSGKKRHSALREMLRTGSLTILGSRNLRSRAATSSSSGDHSSDLSRQVLALVAEHVRGRGLDVPVLPGSHFVHDLDFDSLALLELAVAAEDRLGVAIPEHDLAQLRTVGDLIGVARAGGGGGISAMLAEIERSVPQTFRIVEAQRARSLLIDGRWVDDLASCNYLGLDLHPDTIAAVPEALARWGVHPSWTRAVASPAPYRLLEQRLAAMVGAPDAIVFPTITLLHFGILPRLAGGAGAIVLDNAAHNSMHEAGALARSRGTAVTTFRHGHLEDLEAKLSRLAHRSTRVIAVDGVYSMSGSYADLAALVDIAERHDALLYVDDAHGFGILGEQPSPDAPFGRGGGGIMRHAGVDQSRLVYVAGMSKAFSSMAAFITCRNADERHHYETASTMIFSGPIPVASLASALAGLRVNDLEGDVRRGRLWSLTRHLLDGARDLGFTTDNTTGFPIVNLVLGPTDVVLKACEVMWEHGVLLTPAIFPAAPLDRGGLRFTLTVDNTIEQVERVLTALRAISPSGAPKTLVGAPLA